MSPEHLQHSSARFRLMRGLCGTRCFLDPLSLIASELEGKASRSNVVRDDGIWLRGLGDIDFEMPDLGAACREALRDIPMNRNQRRTMEAAMFDRHGQPTSKVKELAFQKDPGMIRQLAEKYPLSETGVGIAIDVFLGRITRQRLMEELKASFTHLVNFHDWHTKRWDEIAPLLAWLRKEGEKMAAIVECFRTQMHGITEKARETGLSEEEIESLHAKTSVRMPNNILNSVVDGFSQRLGIAGTEKPSSSASPGIFAFASLAASIQQASISGRGRSRTPKRSDLGDILHTLYAPYVDVFRADGFTSSALSRLPSLKAVEIVPSMDLLPSTIDRLLAKK
jgi:hypothetical protein